jgi:hypothetical protein
MRAIFVWEMRLFSSLFLSRWDKQHFQAKVTWVVPNFWEGYPRLGQAATKEGSKHLVPSTNGHAYIFDGFRPHSWY